MQLQDFYKALSSNISKVIKGKDEEIKLVVAALCAKGHVLLEDVPGTGKTVLAKAIAKSIGGDFARIQFTPDLLPSDITGINFFSMKTQQFSLRKGPVFTNILLADEINRATPRTQSALLECMEERQATIDGESYALPAPFSVIATENPVETQGTYPLPEAQLDRFLIRLSLGYSSRESELEILSDFGAVHPLDRIGTVVAADDLLSAQNEVCGVKVNDTVKGYLADIAAATRTDSRIKLGLSTRGLLALMRMSQSIAAIGGRDYVIPDDVKLCAPYVIAHRIICRERGLKGSPAAEIAADILNSVSVPTESID